MFRGYGNEAGLVRRLWLCKKKPYPL